MLDLQRYLQPRPRWQFALWIGALALLVVAGWLAHTAWQNHKLTRLRSGAAAQLRLAAQPKFVIEPSRAELDLRKRWASLENELGFSWYPVFLALEAASSENIELLEFAPDKSARALVLRGEARNEQELFSYVQAVSEQPAFRHVYLAQQKNKAVGALTTIVFELRAQLK